MKNRLKIDEKIDSLTRFGLAQTTTAKSWLETAKLDIKYFSAQMKTS